MAPHRNASHCPPGLAVALVADRAIERAKTVPNRGAYTDLVDIFEFEKKHQTPFTPNVSLLYALNKRMDLLLEETYDKVYQRHLDMAKYTQNGQRNTSPCSPNQAMNP